MGPLLVEKEEASSFKESRTTEEDNLPNEAGIPSQPSENVSHLTTLVLKGKGLKELPSIAGLEKLTELDLEDNELTCLPDSMVALKQLRILKLGRNKLSSVPNCLSKGLFVVYYLDLSYNAITIYTEAPKCLGNLKTLLLNNNKLQCLPLWFLLPISYSFDLLDLSDNPKLFSTSVPTGNQVKSMFVRNVGHLKLANVKLTGLFSITLQAFTSIETLTLSNLSGSNDIVTYVDVFSELVPLSNALKTIEARMLGLSSLCSSISEFSSLEILDVSNNELNWLPNTFGSMRSLTVLRMSATSLFLLPDDLGNLKTLRELYLDGNVLSSLPASFRELCNLEVLDLYNNTFYSLPDVRSLKKLRALDVCMNFFEPPESVKIIAKDVPFSDLRDELLRHVLSPEGRLFCEKESSVVEATPDIDEDCYSLASFGDSCDEGEDPGQSSCSYEVENDENWVDAVWGGDDDFDPNNVPQRLSPYSDKSLKIPYHLTMNPKYFCPFSQPQLVTPRVFTSSDIEDGQFSDS